MKYQLPEVLAIPAPTSTYLPRHLRGAVEAALADTPVVCLLGPRQCGKSTLSRHCEPGRRYVSLDEGAYLDLALADPQGFVDDLPEQVAIDDGGVPGRQSEAEDHGFRRPGAIGIARLARGWRLP